MESGARVLRKLVWSELKGDLAIWRYPRSVLLLDAAGSLAVLAVFSSESDGSHIQCRAHSRCFTNHR